MKLLFDENLAPSLVHRLSDLFPGSAHVHEVGLGACDDTAIWEYAKAHGFAIATKDSDFHERSILAGVPPKVVWIRAGNCTVNEIESMIRLHRGVLAAFEESDVDGVLVLM